MGIMTPPPDGIHAYTDYAKQIAYDYTNNEFAISGVTSSTASGIATKGYIDSSVAGLATANQHTNCRLVITSSHSLNGLAAIDGVTPVAGDRILKAESSAPITNGIYIAASGAWSRATDMDNASEATAGQWVIVTAGTTYANTGWYVSTAPVTIDVDPIVFSQFTGSGVVSGNTTYLRLDATNSPVTGAVTFNSGITLGKTGTAGSLTLHDGSSGNETLTYAKWNSLNDASGIIKGNGSGTFSAATDGTDYLSQSTGLKLSGGTVTGASTFEAGVTFGKNGAAGSLTLHDGSSGNETLTYAKWNSLNDANGIVKCNGSGTFSAATAGSDYLKPLSVTKSYTELNNQESVTLFSLPTAGTILDMHLNVSSAFDTGTTCSIGYDSGTTEWWGNTTDLGTTGLKDEPYDNSPKMYSTSATTDVKLYFVGVGSWFVGGALPTSLYANVGFGTQNAAVSAGGYNGSNIAATNKYDGTSWTASGNITTAVRYAGGCGTQTAGLIFGGHDGSVRIATAAEYDGSTWTTSGVGTLATARASLGGCGTQTAGLCVAGINNSSTRLQSCEEYDGSSWAAGGNITTATAPSSAGTQTAGLCIGGSTGAAVAVNTTEEYDGSSWSGGGNLATARGNHTSSGSQTDAFAVGGTDISSNLLLSGEKYDGSSWSSIASLSGNRANGAAAGDGTHGLIFGGLTNVGVWTTATTEYSPAFNGLTKGSLTLYYTYIDY